MATPSGRATSRKGKSLNSSAKEGKRRSSPKKWDYSKMDIDAISDKMSGEALDFVIAEKERERKKASAQSAGVGKIGSKAL